MGLQDTLIPPQDLAPRLAGLSLVDIPVPTGREEDWRFTPLRRLRGLHEGVSGAGRSGLQCSAEGDHVEFAWSKVDTSSFPAADRIAVAAAELAPTAQVVNIAADAVIDEPVVMSLVGEEGVSYHHLDVRVGAHTKVTIIIDVTGSATLAANVQLTAGPGSNVTLVHIADGDRDQVLAGQHHLRVGADAVVHHLAVTLGGDLVRLVTSVDYAGPGGAVEAAGVYFTDAGQHHEHRLFIDHAVPHCRSDVRYKGAVQGAEAHAVWVGDVFIRPTGKQIETYEMNRNLVLTAGARVDSVPNLEIETGDVLSAGHASTTGRFDEEQLFYLTSRGIPEAEAKRLVVRGFLREVVQRIPGAALQDRLHRRIEQRLGAHDDRFTFDEIG